MNELIKIEENEKGEPVVSARELHEKLEIATEYRHWIARMLEYGFVENTDFIAIGQKRPTAQGNMTTYTDHILTLDTAKEISMLQRNEKGKEFRKYFIEVEKEYNSPEKVMARALRIAEETIKSQSLTIKMQDQRLLEYAPKVGYYDIVLQSKDLVSVSSIAKDYGMSARGLNAILHENKVQYKQGDNWLIYAKYQDKGYTQSKTQTYNKTDGTQGTRMHTYWTQKGRLFLYDFLKNLGILPLIERDTYDE